MNWSQFTNRYACFGCRKAFKPKKEYGIHGSLRTCPDCIGPLIDMGPDFKPPRRQNRVAWAALAANPKPFYGRDGCRPPCCARGGDNGNKPRKKLRPAIGKANR